MGTGLDMVKRGNACRGVGHACSRKGGRLISIWTSTGPDAARLSATTGKNPV
jgi:hypothetical protein